MRWWGKNRKEEKEKKDKVSAIQMLSLCRDSAESLLLLRTVVNLRQSIKGNAGTVVSLYFVNRNTKK
jgi:hypothetical protein